MVQKTIFALRIKGGVMKKLFTVFVVCSIIFGAGICMAGEKVKIATEGAYPPFNFVDPSGKAQGFDVDIADALCKAMGADCELIIQEWDGMIPGLLAKKFDVIAASMSITEERKKAVNFTDPYYEEAGRFATKKGSGLVISKEGLKGKTIGVQRATTWANYLEGVYGKDVNIKFYDSTENHNLDLKSGRLDAVLATSFVIAKWIDSPDGKDFELIGEPVRDKTYIGEGVGIAIRKDDNDLLKKLNTALAQIIADGTHKKIASKYFTVDVYPYK
jgi:lysine-arginine-ornithine-binding protein